MSYVGTIFEYIDNSNITAIPVSEPLIKPMFFAGITSDKGTEDLTVIEGSAFFDQFGNDISYARHGQPLLQAANIINSGGKLLVKRVVAPNSTLANLAVIAKVNKVIEQKTNEAGEPLYIDAITGVETTVSDGNEPIMIDKCDISFETVTVPSVMASDPDQVATLVLADNPKDTGVIGENGSYPVIVITDNGRGVSNKKFRISPDYTTSRNESYMQYNFEVMENNSIIETIPFCFNPDVVNVNTNMSLQTQVTTSSGQVKARIYDDQILKMFANVAAISGNDPTDILTQDILFGKDKKSALLPNVSTSGDVNLAAIYGIGLVSGENGEFGDAPINHLSYETEMVKVFDGTDEDIYDLDNYKIDVVVDANYPASVKRAIEGLATFREDFMYFRDMGLTKKSIAEIQDADINNLKNKFCATYHMSYDIIDPYYKKQVPVTIGYSLARLLVSHFVDGRSRPLAGQLYGMTIPEAIAGTVNFIPKITPAVNQKEVLGDLRINYAAYYDSVLTLETLYTSQELYSQFSFINNILAIQEVTKAIRSRCPKIRYSFLSGEDLNKYKEDVQAVINKYNGNFESITLEYISDATYVANKIFYAAIKVKFKNFIQTEYFKVIALPTT